MKRIFAILTAATLILSLVGCDSSGVVVNSDTSDGGVELTTSVGEDTSAPEESTTHPAISDVGEVSATSTATEGRNEPTETENSFYHYQVGEVFLTDAQWTELLKIWDEVKAADTVTPAKYINDQDLYISFIYGGEGHEVTGYCSDYEEYFIADNSLPSESVYALYDFVDSVIGQSGSSDRNSYRGDASDRLYTYTYPCAEPIQDDEYIAAAKGIVEQWLETLKGETGEYKIESYSMESSRHDSELLGTGIIDGRKEFAVFVTFDVEGIPEDTVFHESGTYDLFDHYYYGECVYARFCWENGECRLIDWQNAFAKQTGSRIEDGLNGINVNNPEYDTFFEFLRDTDTVREKEDNAAPRMHSSRDPIVTKNAVMLSDGDIFMLYIEVREAKELLDGVIVGKMGQSFFDETGDPCYQSPVSYNEALMDRNVLSFTKDFRMSFDDYNCDGNPDYSLNHGDGEFEINCLDADGSPRAGGRMVDCDIAEGDSPLFQIAQSGSIVVWEKDRDTFSPKIVGIDTNYTSTEVALDDYRIYSERYYMPEEFRSYNEGTDTIYFRFWNNTDIAATCAESYTIERMGSGKWEKVLTGSIAAVAADPYSHAEIAVDVSQITDSEMAEYRVVFNVEGEEVYGGFLMGSIVTPSLAVSGEESVPDGRTRLSYTIENTGFSVARLSSAVLYKDNKEIYRFDMSDIGLLKKGDLTELSVKARDAGGVFTAGEYTLVVTAGGEEFSWSTRLVSVGEDRLNYFGGTAEVSSDGNGLQVTIKNGIWDRSTAKSLTYSSFDVFRDGDWRQVPYYFIAEGTGFDGSSPYYIQHPFLDELRYGDSYTIQLDDYHDEFKDSYREYYDYYLEIYDTDPEYAGEEQYSYEDFLVYMLWIAYPTSGEQCRIAIITDTSDEYLYFTMP